MRIIDPFGGTGIYLARLMQICGLDADELDDLYHHRMAMVELDADAAQNTDKNLKTVFTEETGRPARKNVVHNRDTFTLTQDDLDDLVNKPEEVA